MNPIQDDNAADDEPTILVRRSWNDDLEARYRFSDVSGFHWSDISGGVAARAPHFFIHAYVWCDEMLAGELKHSCRHGQGPHRIKVCIVKKGNEKESYKLAERAAGPKPERPKRKTLK